MEDPSKHPRHIQGYEGSFKDLASAIGKMTFDQVGTFLGELAKDIESQAEADLNKRGRKRLAKELFEAAENVKKVQANILSAWKICEPYMKQND
ncbi:MAG: hypothetical protein ACM3PZ_03230 [Bacillota bacterium]